MQVSFEYVDTQLPSYPWTKARTGALHKTNYDIVDAYLCARYTLKRYRYAADTQHYRSINPKTSPCSEDVLRNDSDLKKDFATELAARLTTLVSAGGQKWLDKLDDACTSVCLVRM